MAKLSGVLENGGADAELCVGQGNSEGAVGSFKRQPPAYTYDEKGGHMSVAQRRRAVPVGGVELLGFPDHRRGVGLVRRSRNCNEKSDATAASLSRASRLHESGAVRKAREPMRDSERGKR